MLISTFNTCALLLSVLIYAPRVQAQSLIVEPFSHNSWSISFGDWINLLTLCFSPLLAHVIAGAPDPTVFDSTRPRWHDRLALFNPTSIVWRYITIADRRFRSRRGSWTPQRAAASNALFWTDKGWDGSNSMVISSRRFLAYSPEKPRVRLLSRSAFKSAIVMAQGLQAVWLLIVDVTDHDRGFTLAIDSLFVPLAAMGLVRLFAAPWLLEDFAYSYDDAKDNEKSPFQARSTPELPSDPNQPATWASHILHFLNISIILLAEVMCFLDLGVGHVSRSLSVSLLVVVLYYMIWLGCTAVIFIFYIYIDDRTDTTIIPCISTVWYKVYSVFLTIATVAMIVIVALETQQLPCGKTSTFRLAPGGNITAFCPDFIAVDPNPPNTSIPFGIAMWTEVGQNDTSDIDKGAIRVTEFSGYYVGEAGASHIAHIGSDSA